ncbi:MAG: prepilin-type N-terminal cleavage/methylation domain-containing protein [Aureliella sp.]
MHPPLIINPLHSTRWRQRGVTMVELLAAMMVMSLIMVPLFGVLKASLSISEISSQRQSNAFTRQATLEAIGRHLQGSFQVLELLDQSLTVLQADGSKMRLSLKGEQLILEDKSGAQVLIEGIAKLRFYELGTPTTVAAGRLIGIDVLTLGSRPPYESTISSTQVWVRPAI